MSGSARLRRSQEDVLLGVAGHPDARLGGVPWERAHLVLENAGMLRRTRLHGPTRVVVTAGGEREVKRIREVRALEREVRR